MRRLFTVLAAAALAAPALIACSGGGGGGAPAPAPPPDPDPTPTAQPSPDPTATPGPDLVNLIAERVDPAGECDLLVPSAVPRPVTVTRNVAPGSTCLGGSGDGTSHLAIGARAGDATTWAIVAPGGAERGAVTGAGLAELVRQAVGWHSLTEVPLFSPFEEVELVRLAPSGALERRAALAPPAGTLVSESRIGGDPAGGSVVAAVATLVGGNHGSRVELWRFDAAGATVHPAVVVHTEPGPVVPFLGAGASLRGEAIATFRVPGFLAWTWFARDGTPVATGDVAQIDVGAADPIRVEPLLEGGVAVRFAGAWGAVIPHRGTFAVPAPDWLAARPGTTLRLTRGNRGYAVLPGAGEQLAECSRVADLRAPSGRLCGRITVREGSGGCVGGAVEQGWDGTFIVQSGRDTCSGAACTCTVHAWPRLLAAP